MKYLLLSLLFLSACSYEPDPPKFKVGDCITLSGERESWEKPTATYRVVKLGKEKYLVEFVLPLNLRGETTGYYFSFDNIFKTVYCPKE